MIPAVETNLDARQGVFKVLDLDRLAKDTYRLRILCPELATTSLPGQFFMIRPPGPSGILLGRPFALFDTVVATNGDPIGIDIGFLVVGKATSWLSTLEEGDQVEVWGPLGNGFPAPATKHLLMVAGGIGQTPFLAVTREALRLRRYGSPPRDVVRSPTSLKLLYGVRSEDYLAGLADFRATGVGVGVATDDGSQGHHGYVTDLLKKELESETPPTMIYTCGPEPMMKAVARLAKAHEVQCLASLETPMACGFGACFSCVTEVNTPEGWDYRRVCVEGPVFDTSLLHWDV